MVAIRDISTGKEFECAPGNVNPRPRISDALDPSTTLMVDDCAVSNSILLVEDDDDDVFLIKRALERVARQNALNLKVTHKSNGLEALAALEGRETPDDLPDTIVVDINMPLMDGMTFLHWLRGEPNFKFLHVAVLTTSTELATRAAALGAGADRVYVKPNNFPEMLDIASEMLTNRR